MEAAREAGLDINLRVHVYGFDGIRRMVEAGLGIAILPQGAVLPYLSSRNITAMTLDEPWADRTLYVGYREYRGCRWWHGIWWKCSRRSLESFRMGAFPSAIAADEAPLRQSTVAYAIDLADGPGPKSTAEMYASAEEGISCSSCLLLAQAWHRPNQRNDIVNLYELLERQAERRPIKVGLIGAGKFGAMYLHQVPRTPGVHLVGIADLSPSRAIENLQRVGWAEERYGAASLDDAIRNGTTFVSENWEALVKHPGIDVIVECTGNPVAAVEHCLAAFSAGKPIINVTVEADAFCGPMLAHKARQAGVIYSLAYGDQPALACELVDWARACGFPVVAAGRGHKWLPQYRESTPETVWDHWGLTASRLRAVA